MAVASTSESEWTVGPRPCRQSLDDRIFHERHHAAAARLACSARVDSLPSVVWPHVVFVPVGARMPDVIEELLVVPDFAAADSSPGAAVNACGPQTWPM